jgi:hypothetical protein
VAGADARAARTATQAFLGSIEDSVVSDLNSVGAVLLQLNQTVANDTAAAEAVLQKAQADLAKAQSDVAAALDKFNAVYNNVGGGVVLQRGLPACTCPRAPPRRPSRTPTPAHPPAASH